jgi:methionine biosynthesis protein MetW
MSLLSGVKSRFTLGTNEFGLRSDLSLVASMIEPETRLLDVGCGDGALLDFLVNRKECDGRGMELSQAGVNACVARGLSAVQGDADRHLADYPDDSFDYVILSQTLQAVRKPREVLLQMLRIADTAIVSFLNYGHWRARMAMLTRGRMPHTRALATPWFETANIHPCTVRDFVDLTRILGLTIESGYGLSKEREVTTIRPGQIGQANLYAEQAVFKLLRPERPKKGRRKR